MTSSAVGPRTAGSPPRIVMAGSIGRSVTGGQAWANLQYLLGLQALGVDVTYLEDAGDWSVVYNWERGENTWELDYPGGFVKDSLESNGFRGAWAYRTSDAIVGLTMDELQARLASADVLLIRGIPFLKWREEYDRPRVRTFLDVDPGFTQIRYEQGEPAYVETIDRCEMLFTVGQNVGTEAASVPTGGRTWVPTLPPVYLPAWPWEPSNDDYPVSTIMRWRGMKDLELRGQPMGQKDRAFPPYADLPRRSGRAFSVALTGGGDRHFLEGGWAVQPGIDASGTPSAYQRFIAGSAAEFGIAKHCYVATNTGWFSDRSVCYLASGRPVIVQDTGLERWLPRDQGVRWFASPDEALDRVVEVFDDLEGQSRRARHLAETLFNSDRVLEDLLRHVA